MYFEDIEVGTVWKVGETTYARQEMIHFAQQFDPEPFHIDETWSQQRGPFGDIIASGIYTLGKCRYLDQVHFAKLEAKGLVAVGLESLKYLNPGRPGDILRVTKKCLSKRPSRSSPERGLITFEMKGANQNGLPLIEFIAIVLYERRPREGINEIG